MIRWSTGTAAFLVALSCAQAPVEQGAGPLPRSTPEEQGVRSAGVRAFIEAMDARGDALHGFLLVRHGHVVAEAWRGPGAPEVPHALYSVTKSFTGTAVGIGPLDGYVRPERLSLHRTTMDPRWDTPGCVIAERLSCTVRRHPLLPDWMPLLIEIRF